MSSSKPEVGVAVLVTNGNEILLMKRRGSHGAGTWCPPGGHLEHGESPEECAVREAREEADIEIANVRFLAMTNDVFPEGKHYVTVWMMAERVSGEPRIAAAGEMSEIGWFPVDNLPEPRFLPLENLLEGRSYPRMPG
jgi:8-oxo-dGTP diphosphatase